MDKVIEAKDASPRSQAALYAEAGRVRLSGCDCNYDPDEVLLVVTEALQQAAEIAKRKRCVREFFFGGDMYTVTLESNGTAKVWHHQGRMISAVRLAELCIDAYREMVESNGGNEPVKEVER